MPDQVTQVQPSGGGDGGGGFGPGMMIGIVIVILILVVVFFMYGWPAMNNGGAPSGGTDTIQVPEGNNVPDAGNGGGIEIPDQVDVNVDTPQQ